MNIESFFSPIKSNDNNPKSINLTLASSPNNSILKSPLNKRGLASPVIQSRQDRKRERRIENAKTRDENIRFWERNPLDSQQRSVTHPDYDPTTLYIPPNEFDKLTSFEKQFWGLKRNCFDTVLFFRKGAFYELFGERDTEISARELDLKVTHRGKTIMSGVPAAAFEFWAGKLLSKGYKVAKVDQVETHLDMIKRVKSSSPFASSKQKSKVMNRELTSILTQGTLTMPELISSDDAIFMLAIHEIIVSPRKRIIGYSYLDAACGHFGLGNVVEKYDGHLSSLETLLMQIVPAEVIYIRGNISPNVLSSIKSSLPLTTMYTALSRDVYNWDFDKSSKEVLSNSYFKDKENIPELLNDIYSSSTLEKRATGIALGLSISYLRHCKIDKSIVSMKRFSLHKDFMGGCGLEKNRMIETKEYLSLDGQTILNLEIFENSATRTSNGSLFSIVNNTFTSFGKRLLRRWISHPLYNLNQIIDRQNAVEDLMMNSEWRNGLIECLKSLPDLERHVARIHSGTAKLSVLLDVVDSFKKINDKILDSFPDSGINIKSKRLISLIKTGEKIPKLSIPLKEFTKVFNTKLARKEGYIYPYTGLDSEFDKVVNEISEIEDKLEKHLEENREIFGNIDGIKYMSVGKEQYQLQIPNSVKHLVPDNYVSKSGTKNFSRYWSPFIAKVLPNLTELKEKRVNFRNHFLTKALILFDSFYRYWSVTISCISELDCLISLSLFSEGRNIRNHPLVKPEFIEYESQKGSYFNAIDLVHPCLISASRFDSKPFISNSIILGKNDPKAILLTGPNMGGKSTTLRECCLAIILAQIGCWVPAKKFQLSPVDAIFTRLGARDNIIAGQSTFMVELIETSNILQNASERSFVILDELGRGTSTFDGFSLAFAVLKHLVEKIGCRMLFSTHYHLIGSELHNLNGLAFYYMDFFIDDNAREVTFLYKLAKGVASGSFGGHVAAMAGIPIKIVETAEKRSKKFKEMSTISKFARKKRLENIKLTENEKELLKELFVVIDQPLLMDKDSIFNNYTKIVSLWNSFKK